MCFRAGDRPAIPLLLSPGLKPVPPGGKAMQRTKRTIMRAKTDRMIPFNAPPREPWRLDPDDLRDQVQMAFSTICVADSKRFCQRMLKGLENAGVHVGSSLLMLGIPANGDDD